MPSRKASVPDSSTSATLTPSEPGAPRFARTSPQALARTSLRATLSYRAWNRRFRSCLALRYSTSCKARDFSSLSALLVDLALIGHSPDPLLVRPCTGEAGALRSGRVVLSRPSPLLRPPPTPSRPPATCVGYRRACFPGRRPGAEEGLSSSHDTLPTVPRPMRRGVRGHPLQVLWCRPWPSPTPHGLGSPLAPLARGFCDDAAGFASCCG